MEKTGRKSLSSIISDGDEKPAGTISEKLKGASPYFGLAALDGVMSAYAFSGEMSGSDFFIRMGVRSQVLPSFIKIINYSALSLPLYFGIASLVTAGIFVGLGIYNMYTSGKRYKESYNTK